MEILRYRVLMIADGEALPDIIVAGHDVEWGDRYIRVVRYEDDGSETAVFAGSPRFVRAIFIEPSEVAGEAQLAEDGYTEPCHRIGLHNCKVGGWRNHDNPSGNADA